MLLSIDIVHYSHPQKRRSEYPVAWKYSRTHPILYCLIYSGVFNTLLNHFCVIGKNTMHSQRKCVEVSWGVSSHLTQFGASLWPIVFKAHHISMTKYVKVLSCLLLRESRAMPHPIIGHNLPLYQFSSKSVKQFY